METKVTLGKIVTYKCRPPSSNISEKKHFDANVHFINNCHTFLVLSLFTENGQIVNKQHFIKKKSYFGKNWWGLCNLCGQCDKGQ